MKHEVIGILLQLSISYLQQRAPLSNQRNGKSCWPFDWLWNTEDLKANVRLLSITDINTSIHMYASLYCWRERGVILLFRVYFTLRYYQGRERPIFQYVRYRYEYLWKSPKKELASQKKKLNHYHSFLFSSSYRIIIIIVEKVYQ